MMPWLSTQGCIFSRKPAGRIRISTLFTPITGFCRKRHALCSLTADKSFYGNRNLLMLFSGSKGLFKIYHIRHFCNGGKQKTFLIFQAAFPALFHAPNCRRAVQVQS